MEGGAMYSWIWRHLPGATWLKVLWALSLFALMVVVLFEFVFPWADPRLPFNGNSSLSQ
jgi:hypothetical protein